MIAEQQAIQKERSEKEAAAEALKQQDLLRFKQVERTIILEIQLITRVDCSSQG